MVHNFALKVNLEAVCCRFKDCIKTGDGIRAKKTGGAWGVQRGLGMQGGRPGSRVDRPWQWRAEAARIPLV